MKMYNILSKAYSQGAQATSTTLDQNKTLITKKNLKRTLWHIQTKDHVNLACHTGIHKVRRYKTKNKDNEHYMLEQ